MERLTERDTNGHWRIKEFSEVLPAYWQACNRLAAYEDTGLEPEEICAAQKAMRSALALACELQSYRAFGAVEELSALVKARDEGRVTIQPPPAKDGDPKPWCFYNDNYGLWCLGLSHDGEDEPTDRCKKCWYCESGDYADDRAEAEAALGGGGDGSN